jgi:hypothetical protein
MFALAHCLDGQCRPKAVGGGVPARGSVEITAAVGVNSPNRLQDVRVIQDALNQVPARSGGPAPPLKVDGHCFGKTQAAIKRFQKEACGFKWPDGRISPKGKTHVRLQDFFVEPNPYTMPRIYLMLGPATLWIIAARRVLGDAELHLRGVPGFGRRMELVNRYFHLDKVSPAQATASLAKIRSTYVTMEACVGHSSPHTSLGSGYFQEDPVDNTALAYTYAGGFTRRSRTKTTPPMSREDNYEGINQRQDTILVCPRVLNVHSYEFYTEVIVHELAHFCGPGPGANAIVDHGYRKPAMPPETDPFFKLTPYKALRTADCYSQFAGSAYLGREPPAN